MIFNRKIEVVFSKEDSLILDGQSKICNWLYNHLLDKVKNGNKYDLVDGYNLRNQVPLIKKEYTFLKSVFSSPLKNTALRLKNTFKGYLYEKKGYPKFKSWKRKWFSLYYDEPKKGFKIINHKELKLSLGTDKNNKRLEVVGKLKESNLIKETDKIKNLRICKEHHVFYAVLCIEREEVKQKEVKKWLSIDPNHKNLFVGIDNNGVSYEFNQLSQLKSFDKVIDQLKSKRDKCKKYSKRWMRINKVLDNAYHKRREQIKTACYSISHFITKHYDLVVMGDYTPKIECITDKHMHRSMLNQTIIGQFRRTLMWVMNKSGKYLEKVNEFNTTKSCSICGHKKKKEPHIREFVCEHCHRQLNRDINSSINIAKKRNLLSGSDYVGWELSHVTYTAKWSYTNNKILFTGYTA